MLPSFLVSVAAGMEIHDGDDPFLFQNAENNPIFAEAKPAKSTELARKRKNVFMKKRKGKRRQLH
jgi:hypothetical protein